MNNQEISSRPLISVIIPVYNRAETIARSVQSVLMQDYCNIELLLVDDASTDNSVSVINSYRDPRLRLLCHPVNKGESAARNTGIQNAKGNLIAWLDSDDFWLEGALAKMLAAYQANPSSNGVLANHYLLENDIKSIGVRPFSMDAKKHFLFGMDFGPGSAMLIERICYEKAGLYDEQVRRGPDWEWTIRFYQAGFNFALLFVPVAVVERVHYLNPEVVEKSYLYILDKHKDFFSTFGWINKNRALSKHYLTIALQFLGSGKHSKGWRYLFRGLSTWPFQRPGMYLRLFDALFGTNLSVIADRRRSLSNVDEHNKPE